MGLNVEVYKSVRRGLFDGMDCTMGGISSKAETLCLVNVSGPFEPKEEWPAMVPAAMLVKGNVPGALHIVPAVKNDAGEWVPDSRWFMMGGNYAATSDSRFSDACEKMLGHAFYGAVAIHDRHEG